MYIWVVVLSVISEYHASGTSETRIQATHAHTFTSLITITPYYVILVGGGGGGFLPNSGSRYRGRGRGGEEGVTWSMTSYV